MTRKLIAGAASLLTLATAGVALAGQAAINSKGDFVDLSLNVSPPVAGTAAHPQGVGVSFDAFTGNRINGNTPDTNNSITVRLNRGFAENGLLFPACKINTKALTSCKPDTRIGSGRAEAALHSSGTTPPTFIQATITAYNGKPFIGKAPTLIVIASLGGKPAAELDFTVKQQHVGPYGLALSQIVTSGSSGGIAITRFTLKIPDRSMRVRIHSHLTTVHLVDAPTSCRGSWQYAQTNTFTDASAVTATTSQPCVAR